MNQLLQKYLQAGSDSYNTTRLLEAATCLIRVMIRWFIRFLCPNETWLGPFALSECEIGQTSPIGADWKGWEERSHTFLLLISTFSLLFGKLKSKTRDFGNQILWWGMHSAETPWDPAIGTDTGTFDLAENEGKKKSNRAQSSCRVPVSALSCRGFLFLYDRWAQWRKPSCVWTAWHMTTATSRCLPPSLRCQTEDIHIPSKFPQAIIPTAGQRGGWKQKSWGCWVSIERPDEFQRSGRRMGEEGWNVVFTERADCCSGVGLIVPKFCATGVFLHASCVKFSPIHISRFKIHTMKLGLKAWVRVILLI